MLATILVVVCLVALVAGLPICWLIDDNPHWFTPYESAAERKSYLSEATKYVDEHTAPVYVSHRTEDELSLAVTNAERWLKNTRLQYRKSDDKKTRYAINRVISKEYEYVNGTMVTQKKRLAEQTAKKTASDAFVRISDNVVQLSK